MKLALCMILKPDDETALYADRALESVYKYVDGIFLTITGKNKNIEKLAKKYKAHLSHTKWNHRFDDARNFNFKQVPSDYDWVCWLDSDDIVLHPEKIKPVIEKSPKTTKVIVINYIYARDEYGNRTIEHWRERIVKNTGNWEWQGRLHETLIASTSAPAVKTKDFEIQHMCNKESHKANLWRNIEILAQEAEETKENPDPRTIFYMAANLKELGEFDKALEAYNQFIALSGWDEQRYLSWLDMSRCYEELGKRQLSIDCCLEATKERPDFPDAYLRLAEIYLGIGNPKKALEWVKVSEKKPLPDTELVISPLSYTYTTYLTKSEALLQLGKIKEAKELAEKALELRPKDQFVKDHIKTCEEIIHEKEVMNGFKRIASFLKNNKETNKIEGLIKAVPEKLKDNPGILWLERKFNHKERKWADNEIAIFCGSSWHTWSPKVLKRGISGSEEATIYLAKALADEGWKVTIYNDCSTEAGEYDGVTYKNYWEVNPNDEFNIFVIWRHPDMLDQKIKAKKIYLWLHDVMGQEDFAKDRIDKVEKVIVLSKYHRSLFPNIPDKKIMISKNGIEVADFIKVVPKKRNKMIYTSCPSRGLQYLLELWPEIKKKHPDSTLDVFYGWKNWLKQWGENKKQMKWKSQIDELLKQDGINFLGMKPQKEVANAMLEADFYPYPVIFPEISCCTGDTLIEMPRDHEKHMNGVPIKELVGKSNFPVYSYDNKTDSIVLGTVKWVAKTRKNAEIWKLTLDNGDSLEVTADHKIMLRDGSYKQLKDLNINESLMPVYVRANFMIKQNNGKWIDEHRMVGEWKVGRKLNSNEHVNHFDKSRYNNLPEELEILSASEHHSKTHTGKIKSEQEKAKQKKTYAIWLKSDVGIKTMKETGTKRANKFWQEVFPGWAKEKQREFIDRRVATRMHNHKVVSVKNTGRKEDVYDMEVEKYHNFGANGIIVHNCISLMKAQAAGCIPVIVPYGATNETVKYGYKTNGLDMFDEKTKKEYKEMLLKAMDTDNEKIRKEMRQWAIREYDWKNVAKSWTKEMK